MPTELQELQLRVALLNEAGLGIARLKDELKDFQSGSGKAAMDKLKEEQEELAKKVKELAELAVGGGEALVGYIGKFGAAGAAFAGFAGTLVVGLSSLKEFSDKIVDLTNKAKVIGMNPAELKSIIEQYERLGVSAGVVEQSMAGFSNTLAEINRIGGSKRLEMIQAAGAFGHEMEVSIEKIEEQTTKSDQLHEVLIQAQNVYENRLKETDGNLDDANKLENDFLKMWGLDPALKVLRNIHNVTEEEKKRFAAREAATSRYKDQVTKLSQEWEEFSDDMKTSMLSADGMIVRGLSLAVRLVRELHELWKDPPPWLTKLEEVSKGLLEGLPPYVILKGLSSASQHIPTTKQAKDWLDYIQIKPSFDERYGNWPAPAAPFNDRFGNWPAGQENGAGSRPARFMSDMAGGAAAGSDQIPGIGRGWEWMRRSNNIEDRRQVDESLRQGDDYLSAIEKNTAETKKLNDNFRLLDQGQAELRGLGGLPGFGGGGATGTWGAPNGSRVGPGTGDGAGESHPGSGKGGGAAAGSTDSTAPTEASGAGTGEVGPAAALAIARQHLNEDEIRDEGKLSAWFAKKGIKISPRTTAWCAAFVNASLADAGMKGTGSLAAASFYKYGKGVKGPVQTGDIAVWPHHVAMLTGETRQGPGGTEYQVIGGNQGGTISGQGGVSYNWRSASGMTLRRPDWDQAADRTAVDQSGVKSVRTVKVDVSGKLSAEVNAPRGAEVKVEGGGAFNKTETNRTMPMGD
jgi:hypothetical protein